MGRIFRDGFGSRESGFRLARRGDISTTKQQKITLSASRDIPFNKLMLRQSNARHVKAGVSIEQLAEDIAPQTAPSGLASVKQVGEGDSCFVSHFCFLLFASC